MFLTRLSSYIIDEDRFHRYKQTLENSRLLGAGNSAATASQKEKMQHDTDLDRLIELSDGEKRQLHEIEEKEVVLQRLLEQVTKERMSIESG